MACASVKEYLDKIGGMVLDVSPDTREVGRLALLNIKRNAKKVDTVKYVEDYIKETYLNSESGKAFNKVYNNPTGNKGFDGIIENVKIDSNGRLDLQIKNKDSGKVFNYTGVDISTGKASSGQRIQLAVGLDKKLFGTRVKATVSNFESIQKPINESIQAVNSYTSHMLIGGYEKAETALTPSILRWHAKAKKKSSLYKEAIELISTGFGNPELVAEIKAALFLTGDINRLDIAKLTTISDTIARRNYDILDNELPALDKKIKKSGLSTKEQKDLNIIFGKSGFGNLHEIPGLLGRIEAGESIDTIIDSINASATDKDYAVRLNKYQVDRVVGTQNAEGIKNIGALAVLYTLKEDNRYATLQKMLKDKDLRDLYVELRNLSKSIKILNEIVNNGRKGSYFGEGSGLKYKSYDEHGTIDVYDSSMEFKVVTEEDLRSDVYSAKYSPWEIIRQPKKGSLGIVARKAGPGFIDGLGVNNNRIVNGIPVSKDWLEKKGFTREDMKANNIRIDKDSGYDTHNIVLTAKEFDLAGGSHNVAHTLYRSYVHNKGLIETRTAREFVLDSLTEDGESSGKLKELNTRISANNVAKSGNKKTVKAFLTTDISEEEMSEKYPQIAKMFVRVGNITNYGDFNKDVKYVRRDMKHMIVGYSQSRILPDDMPRAQAWEDLYRQLIQMLKLKLVVANPAKLGMDYLSNLGILMTMDVPIQDVYKHSKESLIYVNEMSQLEGELVRKKVLLSIAEAAGKDTKVEKAGVDKAQKKMEDHPYYEAVKYGFIQSMSTSMMIKEFDTVSGLQHTIDEVVNKITKDKEGRTNKLHDAVIWWMNAGYGMNDVLDFTSNASMIKGTSFGDELIGISDRLKAKKPIRIKEREKELGRKLTPEEVADINSNADVARYVGEFIAAPSSELVRQGSRLMQLADVTSRWTLFQHEIKKSTEAHEKATGRMPNSIELRKIKDDAAMLALDTFIDYRLNLPKSIKALSDYGVLMFPSFWMRAQKVIWNLVVYHPVSAGSGLLASNLFELNGASILDANIINKGMSGYLVSPGQDVFTLRTILPWA